MATACTEKVSLCEFQRRTDTTFRISLSYPCVNSKGKYYIADAYNNRIVSIDSIDGKSWTVLVGTEGAGVNQFNNPQGIWVDPAGHIYISDTGNDRIVRIDDMSGRNWITYGSTGNSAGNFRTPVGIMVR